MYRILKTRDENEESSSKIFTIANGDSVLSDFLAEPQKMERVLKLLNDNEVEPVHAADVIEDFLYDA